MVAKNFHIPSALTPYVHQIVVFEQSQYAGGQVSMHFYPDGFPGLIFHTTETGLSTNRGKTMDKLFLYGQTVNPVELRAQESAQIITFFLHPHVVKSLFGLDASEITDSCVDLSQLPQLPATEIIEKVIDNPCLNEKVDILSKALTQIVQKPALEPDHFIGHAVSKMMHANPANTLYDIRQDLRISERSFERKFMQHVGVSPKQFLRIRQFRAALDQMCQGRFHTLSEVAYDNGYADHSHFTRVFRAFTGLTPTGYLGYYETK